MFSGQTIYSSFQLSTLYLFSSPTFASFGFFYSDLQKETLMSHPEIYKRSRDDKMFSGTRMWAYLIGSLVNAMACSMVPLVIFQNSQSIAGGYPLELWGMGFCLWTNIIFSIILMSAMMVPKWNLNFIAFFVFVVLVFFVVVLTILWIVQDELYDSLPIIIRSPVYYLQAVLAIGIVFIFLCVKVSLQTAFRPEIWRPYAEQEVLEKNPTKTHPLDSISTSL
ncbi:hypothetical protein WA171_006340 [Blastocystis sp. BT1]